MNRWRPWLIDIGLLVITFFLLLFLIIPWGGKNLTQTSTKNNNTGDVVVDMPKTFVPQQSARESIAYLFGWARPVRNNTTNQTNVEKPLTPVANWIIPLSGYVVDENGKFLYLFKNSLNNQILQLPIGGSTKGWKLVAVQANGFLFEYEGKKYIVNKD